MSGANNPTTVSGANNPTTVSGDETTTADESASGATEHAHEAHIQVVKGRPTDEELAALIAVLAAASSAPAEPREQEVNLWGHPVDRLRYSIFSWQRVTLLERTHMRHR